VFKYREINMKAIVSFILLSVFYFSLLSCNTTDPGEDNTTPGRRDYEWTVDTLSSPPNYFYLYSLWGSSPTNLWAVGYAGESINSIWHFNGTVWKKSTQRLSSNIFSIWGSGSADIWCCDSPGGNIFYYNGSLWNKIGYFPYKDYQLTYLNNIWGTKKDDVYLAGSAYDTNRGIVGFLMHYDGSNWNYLNMPEKNYAYHAIRKSSKNGYIYILAVEYGVNDKEKILSFDGKALNEIYTENNSNEVMTVKEMNGDIYLCIGPKIYKPKNSSLELWKDFSNTRYLGRVWGRSEKDFFGVASDGLVHYNGTDLVTIYPTSSSIVDGFIFEKDIFIICDFRIIIHGKLKSD
jgi:hypothetical protein